ncbi:unnamed protein product [Porites evermanni]|uniref:Metalloendopeptidase n=1 Tax=Porites evermanni TaxID=104178 RepID=A0ABN8LUS3_9CNID|nr:unnamed protein product [Porites evermanni]
MLFLVDSHHSPGGATSLYGGDIKFTPKQKENMKKYGTPNGPQTRAASNVDSERWPNAVIPYVFDCSVANMESAVAATLQAMRMWESKTCIRFVERTTEKAYLELFRGQGCWGHVGHHGYKTQISIGDNCDFQHVMEHELGHTVGFWHEQSRPDRDNYISVIWENVLDGLASAFEKRKWNTEVVDFGVPYDFASIMHYPFTAFSKNGKPTIRNIVDMQGKTPYIVLSDGDARQTNAMYKCNVVMAKRAIDRFSSFKPAPRVQKTSNQCTDKSGRCASYKKNGLCTAHADNMLYWCPVTCDMCSSDSCMDKNGNCPIWAKDGHCQSNPESMNTNCEHSCKVCGGSTLPPTAPTTTQSPSTGQPSPSPPTGSPPPPTGSPAPSLGTAQKFHVNEVLIPRSGYFLPKFCLPKKKNTGIVFWSYLLGSCATPLGLGWDYKLPDSAFSASSEMSPGFDKKFRFNFVEILKNECYLMKVLLQRFHLKGQGFRPQTQKLEKDNDCIKDSEDKLKNRLVGENGVTRFHGRDSLRGYGPLCIYICYLLKVDVMLPIASLTGSTLPPTAPPTTQSPSTSQPSPSPPTGSPPPPTGSPAPSLGTGLRCADKSASCPSWAASGQCSKSGWTFRNCLISCKAKCDNQPIQPTGSCTTPLGLGWDYKLPDSGFSASSEMSPGGGWVAGAKNARLYFEDNHDQKRIGGWCASSRNPQWIKVDLGRVKKITGIATQGRDVFYEHVKKYELEFSTDGVSWQPYEEGGAKKVFDGNCDHFTPVINRFNPVRARFVKVIPHDNPQGWMCMRLEFYGCDS